MNLVKKLLGLIFGARKAAAAAPARGWTWTRYQQAEVVIGAHCRCTCHPCEEPNMAMKISEAATRYYAAIPARLLRGLVDYAEKRNETGTGSFLRAIVENDLMSAVTRADPESFAALSSICAFVHNELPAVCWGTKDKVRDWLESGRRMRLDESSPPSPAVGVAS
jgi:hypothetical protein